MSLDGKKIIKGVQLDITPNGGGLTSRQYIAERVVAEPVKIGDNWITGDGRRHVNIRFRYIKFTIEGELIDQTSNTGDTRHPIEVQEDLIDPSGFTVELLFDLEQAKSFEVIAENVEQSYVLAEFVNLARNETEKITCITRDKVSRADYEWFKRY